MSWIDHIISLPNPLNLASFFVGRIFSDGVRLMLIDVILILTIHATYIFLLTRFFKRYVVDTLVGVSTKASLLSYLLMILLVILSHISDIFILTLALEAMKVFPDPLTTFHYVSGMYTTIGSSYSPGQDWQGLSMLISFTGLFAFSISGSGLFSMLSYFIESGNSNMKAKS
jgi:hypothetical protein